MMFLKNYVWGAASVAYQIEGAYNKNGKGESTWNSYHPYPEDIAIL